MGLLTSLLLMKIDSLSVFMIIVWILLLLTAHAIEKIETRIDAMEKMEARIDAIGAKVCAIEMEILMAISSNKAGPKNKIKQDLNVDSVVSNEKLVKITKYCNCSSKCSTK